MTARLTTYTGIAAIMLSVTAAAAPSVAVIATDKCDQPTILTHAKSYRHALEAHLGADLLTEADLISRLGGAPRQFLSLGEVERLLTGATTDVFEGQTVRALKTLTGVTEDVERLPPSPARFDALVNVLSLIGHVHLKQAKSDSAAEAAAAATFERILRVDPKWAPNADLYPPATQAFVAKLRAKAQKKTGRVGLTITTKPSGLPVFVDAKPLGSSPQTIQLPAGGSYSVEVDWGEGKRGLARTVNLEAAASIELDKTFEGSVFPDKACVRTDGSRKGRLAIAARLTSVLGVQTVHAIREEEPAAQERFVTAVTLNSSGEERVEGRIKLYAGTLTPAAWDSFVTFMLTGERPLPPVEAISGPGLNSKSEAVTAGAAPADAVAVASAPAATGSGSGLRTAGFVAAGVGVVGAGLAVFFGFQTGAANRRLADACPMGVCPPGGASAVQEAERSGSASSTFTLVSGAVAGAFVVTSIVLFIAASQSSSPVQVGGLTLEPSASGVLLRF